jgi:hypothetical protein
MNKNGIIALVAIIIVAIAVGVFMSKGDSNPSTDSTVAGNETATGTVNEQEVNSLEAAFAQGGSYKCTFSMKDAQTETSGTYYIDNKKVSGEFSSFVPAMGKTVESHLISDGRYTYTWTNQSSMGFKMPTPQTAPNAQGETSANITLPNNMGNMSNVSYDCDPWNADASKFIAPKNITFQDAPTAR